MKAYAQQIVRTKTILQFTKDYGFRRNDLLSTDTQTRFKVVKVYRNTLLKRFLSLFGLKFKIHAVKVIEI